MNQFEFKRIGNALKNADDIPLHIEPLAAYHLVALLQLALRHPSLKVEHSLSYENGIRVTRLLQDRLAEIDPMIAESLETGWDESLDMSTQDYQQFSKTGDLPQRNYSQLRPDIQEEVIGNSVAFGIAVALLAQYLGGSQEQWIEQISIQANEAVNQMSREQIQQQIAQLDFMRDFQGDFNPE